MNGLNTPIEASPHPVAGQRVPIVLRTWRLARLGLHLLAGALIVLAIFPWIRPEHRSRMRQRWSARLLGCLGIGLDVAGETVEQGGLIVSNHISWLDVFVINALAPSAFIAKAEVRNWPLLGWLAARNDTVFLRRGSRGHAHQINSDVARLLDAGGHVALFPEGTTTDGSRLLHFHAALLQPALTAGHRVQPVALKYLGADGQRSTAPAYVGDTSLWSCLVEILAADALTARIDAAPALPADFGHRRDIARTAREAIAQRLMLPSDTRDADIGTHADA